MIVHLLAQIENDAFSYSSAKITPDDADQARSEGDTDHPQGQASQAVEVSFWDDVVDQIAV